MGNAAAALLRAHRKIDQVHPVVGQFFCPARVEVLAAQKEIPQRFQRAVLLNQVGVGFQRIKGLGGKIGKRVVGLGLVVYNHKAVHLRAVGPQITACQHFLGITAENFGQCALAQRGLRDEFLVKRVFREAFGQGTDDVRQILFCKTIQSIGSQGFTPQYVLVCSFCRLLSSFFRASV
ncbi:hypothetical protein SDC9_111839 [bioreactor metagenome]|uniref:Uncharacterized protein n=1 Tax=bioreactor metagenome TaxID=1076179 RepID=A0A645BHU4_9ZZZZ